VVSLLKPSIVSSIILSDAVRAFEEVSPTSLSDTVPSAQEQPVKSVANAAAKISAAISFFICSDSFHKNFFD